MRQSGILAAAGLHALSHHRERLAQDHARARTLAEGAGKIPELSVAMPETNIVMIDILGDKITPESVLEFLSGEGILMVGFGPRRLRAVTHLDVDDAGVAGALEALRKAVDRLSDQ